MYLNGGQLLSIRDDLFDTFRKRHHGSAEVGDVQLTSESLQRYDTYATNLKLPVQLMR